MPRTFTLFGLMLAVTLICILCGLVVNYPEQSLAYAIIFASLLPTAIVCLTLVSFSQGRKTVLALSFLGAGLSGMCCFPAQFLRPPGNQTELSTHVRPLILPLATLPTIGAALFGGAALADDILNRRKRTNDGT